MRPSRGQMINGHQPFSADRRVSVRVYVKARGATMINRHRPRYSHSRTCTDAAPEHPTPATNRVPKRRSVVRFRHTPMRWVTSSARWGRSPPHLRRVVRNPACDRDGGRDGPPSTCGPCRPRPTAERRGDRRTRLTPELAIGSERRLCLSPVTPNAGPAGRLPRPWSRHDFSPWVQYWGIRLSSGFGFTVGSVVNRWRYDDVCPRRYVFRESRECSRIAFCFRDCWHRSRLVRRGFIIAVVEVWPAS